MLLIAFGAGLAWIRFLGRPFIGELNKLVFWVALPALVFRAAAHAGSPTLQTLVLVAAVAVPTLLVAFLSWISVRVAGLPGSARSTFIATSFFGNLAYIGIPIIAHSLGRAALGEAPELLATALLVMAAMTIINNAVAVAVFQRGSFHPLALARHVLANPIVIGGCLGILYGLAAPPLPPAFDQVLESLGGTAVPLALICIGGSLEMTPLRGHLSWIASTSVLKVFALPALGWMMAQLLGLNPSDTRIVLILCACPTAVVAYTMATQMNGDEPLAAGAIATSTVISFASLAAILALT